MSTTFFDYLRHNLSAAPAIAAPVRFLRLTRLAWQVQRERSQLARLTRSELAEMGIHPGDAAREAERSMFDLPKSRLNELR